MEVALPNTRYINEPPLRVPKNLQNEHIIDPLHPETFPKQEKPVWYPPRRHPVLESFFAQPTIKDHPDYHASPVKSFDKTVKFHDGIQQVYLLIKTKPIQGLPTTFQRTKFAQNETVLIFNQFY